MTEATNQELNGHPSKGPTVAEVHAWMRAFIAPICACTVNGVLRSMPQIPVDETMVMICRLLGEAVGATLSVGDLSPVLQLRAKCREAFIQGMSKTPIRPSQTQPSSPAGRHELIRKVAEGNA